MEFTRGTRTSRHLLDVHWPVGGLPPVYPQKEMEDRKGLPAYAEESESERADVISGRSLW
ncbi:hypothetical protein BDS110ZK25_70300 [Bradyrhizobium diazoefficiens]